jgi:TolB-like protein
VRFIPHIPALRVAAPWWPVCALLALSGCGNAPEFYRGDVAAVEPGTRVAVLPPVNFSRDERAPDVIAAALVVELLATNRFLVVDPGQVEQVVLANRVRMSDRLPLADIQKIGAELGAEYVVVGSVNEYGMVQDAMETVPVVSFAVRMVSCSSGVILWAATHSKRGDDNESMFELGRVETTEELAAVAVREAVSTLKTDPSMKKSRGAKAP